MYKLNCEINSINLKNQKYNIVFYYIDKNKKILNWKTFELWAENEHFCFKVNNISIFKAALKHLLSNKTITWINQ